MLAFGDDNPLVHIRRPWVNQGLVLFCIVVFFLFPPIETFALFPAQLTGAAPLPPQIEEVPVWVRLVTYTFLHGGLAHIAGNLLTLWVFGDNVEDALGHVRYLVFFLIAGAVGGVTEAFFSSDPTIPVVGASGAVSGVLGAYLMMHPRAKIYVLAGFRIPVALPAGVFVGMLIALNLVMALTSGEGATVAWWAHLGGFAAGMGLVTVMRYNDVPLFQPASAYPAPTGRFAFARRLVIDLTPRAPRHGALPTLGGRMLAVVKAIGFFVAITLAVELFVP